MADASWVTGVVSAQEARMNDGGLIAKTGPTALDVRTGAMFGPGSSTIVTGTSATGTMTVNVAAHHWVSSRGTANGPYRGTKETSTTLNIAAAPGSNSRIDVVWAKMQDDTAGVPTPDAAVGEQYGVTTGTAAASPTKPAIPLGAVEIATVQIAAGTTSTLGAGSTITNTALQVVATGAPIPVRNTTERNALTTYAGLHVVRLDQGGVIQRWVSGTTWRTYAEVEDHPSTWPVASLRQSTIQSGLATGWQTIPLEVEDIDSHNGHSTSTNTSRYTVPSGQGGTYAVEGAVAFGSMASGLLVNARITKNGAASLGTTGAYGVYSSSSGTGAATGTKLMVLAAGDYVELQGYVNSGGWSTSVFDANASSLNIHRIR